MSIDNGEAPGPSQPTQTSNKLQVCSLSSISLINRLVTLPLLSLFSGSLVYYSRLLCVLYYDERSSLDTTLVFGILGVLAVCSQVGLVMTMLFFVVLDVSLL